MEGSPRTSKPFSSFFCLGPGRCHSPRSSPACLGQSRLLGFFAKTFAPAYRFLKSLRVDSLGFPILSKTFFQKLSLKNVLSKFPIVSIVSHQFLRFPLLPTIVLFEHRIRFPGFPEVFWKEGSLERMGEGSTRRMTVDTSFWYPLLRQPTKRKKENRRRKTTPVGVFFAGNLRRKPANRRSPFCSRRLPSGVFRDNRHVLWHPVPVLEMGQSTWLL